MSVNKVDFQKPRCEVCKKRFAISVCDFPVMDSVAYIHRKGILSVEQNRATCDLPLCENCRIHVNEHFDLCPAHATEIKIKMGG